METRINNFNSTIERRQLGKFLRSIRIKRGLSQEKLAQMVDLKRHAVMNIENGGPSELNSILNIVRHLGCELTVNEK